MKKLVSALCVCAITITALAGCTANQTVTQSQAGLPAASNSDKENVTLSVYAGTFPLKETVDKITADYKEQTGVSIEWEIPGDEPYTLLKTRFASNEAPDIFELANGDHSSWGVRCLDLTGEIWQEHVSKTVLEGATIDGKILGFPMGNVGNGIVYNKELFSKAGIEKIPQTVEELKQTCEKLEAAGIQPFGEAYKEWGFLQHIFGAPFAYEKDTKAFCAEIAAGTKKVGDLTYIDGFFDVFSMTIDYGKGTESVGYGATEQIPDFAAGKMAMIKQGTWYGDALWSVNPELKIGLFAVPLTNNAQDTKLMTTMASYLSVANTTAHEKEAKAFLVWLYENAQKYIVDGFAVAAPYDNVDLSNLGSLFEDMQKYIADDKAFPIGGSEYFPAGFATDIATPLQSYAAGVMDKQAAIDALQKAYENRLGAQG